MTKIKEKCLEQDKKRSPIDVVWDIFTSVKLAVVVFIVVAATSIVGTLIEQNAAPERNLKLLTKFFGQSAAPTAFRIFDSLGFMDMYHSWWFFAILIIFAANLIICSIDRLPMIMKLVREPLKPLSENSLSHMRIKQELLLKGRPEKTKETVAAALKRAFGGTISEAVDGGGVQLYGQKGAYTRLGVYVVHFSIVLILFGAVIGLLFGFNGYLNLPEGGLSSVAYSRTGKEKPLGFDIRCEEFDVEFYGSTDMPKKYKSLLTIIENGKPVSIDGKESYEIAVNKPLRYKGVTFYQSSYGMVQEGGEKSIFRFKVRSKDGRAEDLNIKFGESFTLPGTELVGKIDDFSPALGFDEKTNRPFTYAEMMNNPAVYLSFSEKGLRKYGGWVLKRYPETWRLPEGHTVEFTDIWGLQYTGLQVRQDPGVWVVYAGCLFMVISLYIAFFTSHKRIWIRLTEEKGNTRVIIAASSNKNKQAMARKIEQLAGLLSKNTEGGK